MLHARFDWTYLWTVPSSAYYRSARLKQNWTFNIENCEILNFEISAYVFIQLLSWNAVKHASYRQNQACNIFD
jgi:hypothetical protein